MGSEQLETIFVDESGDHHQMIEVHELGFVKLIDTMGDDEEVRMQQELVMEKEQERYHKHGTSSVT